MNKKYVVLGLSAVASFGVLAGAAANMLSRHALLGTAEEKTYTITIDKNCAIADGRITYRTPNGTNIYFDVAGFTPADDGDNLGTFEADGYIKNPYIAELTHNNYIGGITKVTVNTTGSFTADYTWGSSLTAATPYYQRRGYVINNAFPDFSFLDERPNFLMLTAKESSLVSSISIHYTCERGAERGDNLCIDSVSKFERFKTVVNRGNSFQGQTVELVTDLDMSSQIKDGTTWCIGSVQNTPFSGTFEGNGHTISNYTISGDTGMRALFAHASGATIRNLKMSNVNVSTGKATRAASLIARADQGCVISNVEILSGNIAGAGESGGIVAISAARITMSDCVNRAKVNSSGNGGGANGGILGYAYAGVTKIENCVNRGDIYGNKDGVGGILGLTREISTLNLDIDGCRNYGAISGAQNVGGIAGLPRGGASTSIIEHCGNFASVSGTAYVGGIVGRARVIVDDCGCHEDADILMSGSPNKAGSLNAVGGASSTPGYIAGTEESGGNNHGDVHANCHLITGEIGAFSSYVAVDIGPAYTNGRIIKLQNGKYLLTAVSGYAIADTIGENAFANWKTRVNSYGWDYIPDTKQTILSSNFMPIQLPDGRIAIFYRTNPTKVSNEDANPTKVSNEDEGYYYSSIRAIVSSDYGAHWTRYRLFENYSYEGSGAYEPFPVLRNNVLQVYFACDIRSTKAAGLGPNNAAFVEEIDAYGVQYQNILRTPIDVSDGGFDIGATAMAIEATPDYRRPGMPTVVTLTDGTYAMVYEHCGSAASFEDYAMVVAISYSHDLLSWSAPRTIIAPSLTGVKNGKYNLYRCGAPCVQLLPSGRIAVSYMTNEYYQGYEYEEIKPSDRDEAKTNDSWFRTLELAVSEEVVTDGMTPSMTRLENVRSYGENEGSCYGGCAVQDDKLILIGNSYRLNADGTRTKLAGLTFSSAELLKP